MGCQSATLFHTLIQDLAKRPYTAADRPGGASAEGRVPKPPASASFYRDRPALSARLQPLTSIDPLNAEGGKTVTADYAAVTQVDYLADGGKALDAAIAADPVVKDRLEAALALFVAAEKRSQDKVDTVLASL